MPGQRYDVPLGVGGNDRPRLSVFEEQVIPLTVSGGSGGGYSPLRPATDTTLGGVIVGEDLQITQEGVLSIVKANAMEQDNTHPITSAAVFVEVGNINALLETI